MTERQSLLNEVTYWATIVANNEMLIKQNTIFNRFCLNLEPYEPVVEEPILID